MERLCSIIFYTLGYFFITDPYQASAKFYSLGRKEARSPYDSTTFDIFLSNDGNYAVLWSAGQTGSGRHGKTVSSSFGGLGTGDERPYVPGPRARGYVGAWAMGLIRCVRFFPRMRRRRWSSRKDLAPLRRDPSRQSRKGWVTGVSKGAGYQTQASAKGWWAAFSASLQTCGPEAARRRMSPGTGIGLRPDIGARRGRAKAQRARLLGATRCSRSSVGKSEERPASRKGTCPGEERSARNLP